MASLFMACGVPASDAATTAEVVVAAELRGRSGHGVRRIKPWIGGLRSGKVNPTARVSVESETPVSALVNGDNGLGPVVATRATQLAIAKAKESGLAWIGTHNSNHAGAAGVYPAMVVREGLIGIFMAVGNLPSMPPWGGRELLLGTNPVAVGVPAGSEPDFLLDIATTTASRGAIRVRAEAGEDLPEGWVVDTDGTPIVDPNRVDEGFLTPIGGHKGSGLAMMVGFLAGTLNGAAFGRDSGRTDRRVDTGQMVLAARPDLFRPRAEFLADMDRHVGDFRQSAPLRDGPVRIPGESAARTESEQRRHGVIMSGAVRRQLDELAEELGVEPM